MSELLSKTITMKTVKTNRNKGQGVGTNPITVSTLFINNLSKGTRSETKSIILRTRELGM